MWYVNCDIRSGETNLIAFNIIAIFDIGKIKTFIIFKLNRLLSLKPQNFSHLNKVLASKILNPIKIKNLLQKILSLIEKKDL